MADQSKEELHNRIDRLERRVDLIIDGGNCGLEPTTVVRLDGGEIEIQRHGRGPVTFLEEA